MKKHNIHGFKIVANSWESAKKQAEQLIEADRKHTEYLKKLDKNSGCLLILFIPFLFSLLFFIWRM